MRLKSEVMCPKCDTQGFPRLKRVKQWRYSYFGHRIKKDHRWTTRWCYLGKPDDRPDVGPSVKLGNNILELGTELGIKQAGGRLAYTKIREKWCREWDSNPRYLAVTDLAGLRPTRLGDPGSCAISGYSAPYSPLRFEGRIEYFKS